MGVRKHAMEFGKYRHAQSSRLIPEDCAKKMNQVGCAVAEKNLVGTYAPRVSQSGDELPRVRFRIMNDLVSRGANRFQHGRRWAQGIDAGAEIEHVAPIPITCASDLEEPASMRHRMVLHVIATAKTATV